VHLAQAGIESSQIQGYDQEEYTQLKLEAAISSDRADCGQGIHVAAAALDLGFIPFYEERYVLKISIGFCESELLEPFWSVLESNTYRPAIDALTAIVQHLWENLFKNKAN